MSDRDSNDLGAFLAGFVIGSLVGAAVAFVLAPQSGEETRNQILSRSNALREQAGQYGNDYRDRAGSYLSDARSRVQDAGTQVQERINNIVLDEGKVDGVTHEANQTDTLNNNHEDAT